MNSGWLVPEDKMLIWLVVWYNRVVPLSPTARAVLPLGFQLIECMVFVLGSGICVTERPSYLTRIPPEPPMSA